MEKKKCIGKRTRHRYSYRKGEEGYPDIKDHCLECGHNRSSPMLYKDD